MHRVAHAVAQRTGGAPFNPFVLDIGPRRAPVCHHCRSGSDAAGDEGEATLQDRQRGGGGQAEKEGAARDLRA